MKILELSQAALLGVKPLANPSATGKIRVTCPIIENPLDKAEAWAEAQVKRLQINFEVTGKPHTPSLSQLKPGWNLLAGDRWVPSDPVPGGYVFDTETFGSYKQYPVIGVLAGEGGWFLWISPWLFGEEFTPKLIHFPQGDYTLIAHNAAFDVARVANSYTNPGQIQWLCTQSMAQVTRGISPRISSCFKGIVPRWVREQSTRVALLDCVRHWVGGGVITREDKALRDTFKNAKPDAETWDILTGNWDRLLGYAINDVWATYLLFDKLWEEYLDHCPSWISIWALSYLHTARMPINPEFEDWMGFCDREFEAIQSKINSILGELCKGAIATGLDESHPAYPWYRHLDWSATSRGEWAGIPKFARKLTMRSRSLPYLLRLSWNGNPIQHTREDGWHYLVDGEVVRLPHKDGEDAKVGNPLADTFRHYIESGTLRSEIPGFDLAEFHTLYFNTTYWIGARKRIGEVAPFHGYVTQGDTVHRTLTRRAGGSLWSTVPDLKEGKIGTSIKAQVRPHPGYVLVGADFSTQETAIAALFQDAYNGTGVGSSQMSLTQFTGRKEDKTDSHSLLATQFGINRSAAKRANFASQYGCGVNKISEILRVETGRPIGELRVIAKGILDSKRGKKQRGMWVGGTESGYLNYVVRRMQALHPSTPLLGVKAPRWFAAAKDSFWTTVANYPVQSTGVDLLHLFLALVAIQLEESGLDGIQLAITRHDEVWYECPIGMEYLLAEKMQSAHLATWACLVAALGLESIPESLCLFPEINVDTVLRKETDTPVWDGFGEEPVPGYTFSDTQWKEI
ncbi:MAG: DNA polymerase [Candidatus Caldarchaeum sp.]